MASKTRYLQLSDTMLMEYVMNDDSTLNDGTVKRCDSLLYTKLRNGHLSVLSPLSCELKNEDGSFVYKTVSEYDSINTIHHFSVPLDSTDGGWYTMADYKNTYVDDSIMESISDGNVSMRKYFDNCFNPETGDGGFEYIDSETIGLGPRFDHFRIYFVNGYFLEGIYGITARISLKRTDGLMLDLCNFFFNRDTISRFITYVPNPIFFGNYIYDRYIEISIPSIYDILNLNEYLKERFLIDETSPIRLSFSYVGEDNSTESPVQRTISEYASGESDDSGYNPSIDFVRSVTMNGSIPFETIPSDSLGVYMAIDPDCPFIHFYGTWKDMPLSHNIVQQFNKRIHLYDDSLVKKMPVPYDVDDDYEAELNLRKWIAVHDIKCIMMSGDTVVHTDSYSMSQSFVDFGNTEIVKFMYRPAIFDADIFSGITDIVFNYTMRFMNVDDRVQFTKSCSLSTTDIERFYGKGTDLKINDVVPYKIYNKIENGTVGYSGENSVRTEIRYVRTFYSSNEITITDGTSDYANNTYMLTLSTAPKSYLFIFRGTDTNGTRTYMDLTSGNYKLYVRNGGNSILVEPSYSSNMNRSVGELEFYLGTNTISKLMNVSESDRRMSIVSYGDDGSVSSMYDFSYTF